jgi:hypothetical protein
MSGLCFLAETYSLDDSFIEHLEDEFELHPDYARKHLLFSTLAAPLIPLTVHDISSLLSADRVLARAEDRPSKVSLHVRFCGSSDRILQEGLCWAKPIVCTLDTVDVPSASPDTPLPPCPWFCPSRGDSAAVFTRCDHPSFSNLGVTSLTCINSVCNC